MAVADITKIVQNGLLRPIYIMELVPFKYRLFWRTHSQKLRRITNILKSIYCSPRGSQVSMKKPCFKEVLPNLLSEGPNENR